MIGLQRFHDVKQHDDVEVTVRRARKGGKGRVAPFGTPDCRLASITTYAAAVRHRLAESGDLWVGAGGKSFGYQD